MAAGAVSLAVVVSAHTLLGEMVPKNLVPWERVTSVDDSMSLAEMRQIAAGAGHSRLPVLRGDKVAGFVHVLDLQRRTAELPLKPVFQVPRSRRLVDVFEDLRQQSRGPAIVLDEAGQALGVVTLEDLLAELLGRNWTPAPEH